FASSPSPSPESRECARWQSSVGAPHSLAIIVATISSHDLGNGDPTADINSAIGIIGPHPTPGDVQTAFWAEYLAWKEPRARLAVKGADRVPSKPQPRFSRVEALLPRWRASSAFSRHSFAH